MLTGLETTFVFPLLKVLSDSLALTATRRLVRDNLHLKARGVTLGSLRMRANTEARTSKKDKTVPRRKIAKLILRGGPPRASSGIRRRTRFLEH